MPDRVGGADAEPLNPPGERLMECIGTHNLVALSTFEAQPPTFARGGRRMRLDYILATDLIAQGVEGVRVRDDVDIRIGEGEDHWIVQAKLNVDLEPEPPYAEPGWRLKKGMLDDESAVQALAYDIACLLPPCAAWTLDEQLEYDIKAIRERAEARLTRVQGLPKKPRISPHTWCRIRATQAAKAWHRAASAKDSGYPQGSHGPMEECDGQPPRRGLDRSGYVLVGPTCRRHGRGGAWNGTRASSARGSDMIGESKRKASRGRQPNPSRRGERFGHPLPPSAEAHSLRAESCAYDMLGRRHSSDVRRGQASKMEGILLRALLGRHREGGSRAARALRLCWRARGRGEQRRPQLCREPLPSEGGVGPCRKAARTPRSRRCLHVGLT